MPKIKLVLGSDGERVVVLGPWAKQKLFYIQRYADIFNTGMKGQWKTRCYIDLFSGPGRCLISRSGEEVDGSPIVALKCTTPFTHYFFNDDDPSFTNALKARTALWTPMTNIKYFCKDCNEIIPDLRAELPQGSLDFCFIDPFGWEIRFDSVKALTQDRRMDLAITFHSGQIKRFAHGSPDRIDSFMGLSGFSKNLRAVLDKGTHEATRFLLDAYGNQLRAIGYTDITDRVLVELRRNKPLYHLLFAAKAPRGKDFWDKISARLPNGRQRML